MVSIQHAIGAVVLVLAGVGALYAIASAEVLRRKLASRETGPTTDTPASLLKPLYGPEPGLEGSLSGFAQQNYAAPFQVVLGLQDSADPAMAVAEGVRSAHPETDIEVVVDERVYGPNRKVSNLINMAARARHDLLVLSDADIAVKPDYLRHPAQAASEPGVGAVTCLYFGQGRAGVWSQLAAMGISYGFLPNVALGSAIGAAQPCMGSTIALRRGVLDEIGGFESLIEVLADDYELGREVREKGYRIAIPSFVVEHGCDEASLKALFDHELRWAVTVRILSPGGHFGSVVTHPLPLALIGAVLVGVSPWSLGVLALAIVSRYWLMSRVDRAVGVSSGPWQLLPVRDMLSFGVFLASLTARKVRWKGERHRITSKRTLSPA